MLGLLIVMGLYAYGTFQFSDRSQPGIPNARSFPLALLGILAVLTIVLVWTSRDSREEPDPTAMGLDIEADDALLEEDPSLLRLGIMTMMVLAYLYIMPSVGFFFSTVLLGVAMQIIIFRGPRLLSLVVAIALSAGAWWLFAGFLSIPLP